MKKLSIFFLCALFILPSRAVCAGSSAVYDTLTGVFYLENNAFQRRGIASTTKIMTCLLALELYELDRTVRIRPEWCGIEGSSMYLKPGEEIKIRDLLYGLMLSSGNDAATALSCLYSGDSRDFTELMCRTAREAGAFDTSFTNPHGLDGEGHYSTACDLALITARALENEEFAAIVSAKSYSSGERTLVNHNRLLSTLADCIGVKTGYTRASGRCLVSAVMKWGRPFICVTLDDPDDWRDHEQMYREVFSLFEQRCIMTHGEAGSVYVAGHGMSKVYASDDIFLFCSGQEEFEIRLYGPRVSYPPIRAGDEFGRAVLMCRGKTVLSVPVYYSENVEEQARIGFFKRIFSKR